MTREEKILLAIEKGYTCDTITGKVYGPYGKEIKIKDRGYIDITLRNSNADRFHLRAHQFIWYWVNKEVVDCIDHINGIRDDNRIDNLRSVTQQQNNFNRKISSNDKIIKGYSWHIIGKKWQTKIKIDGKTKHIGLFNTEEEARQAYLNAKEIYHII